MESTKFHSPILKKIAKGDLSVVNDINKDNINIRETFHLNGTYTYTPLTVASENGHINILNRLLEYPSVVEQLEDNYVSWVLYATVENSHVGVLERLLNFKSVRDVMSCDTKALNIAAKNRHFEILNMLLNISSIVDTLLSVYYEPLRHNKSETSLNRIIKIAFEHRLYTF
jgi:ankyrin repeat protein